MAVGPLLGLRIFGFCCPCLESEDDHATRVAAYNLQRVPINWHRKVKGEPGVIDGITAFFNESEGQAPSTTVQYASFLSTLNVVDTDFGPAIEVKCHDEKMNEHEFLNEHDVGCASWGLQIKTNKTVVPLQCIDVVSKGDGWNAMDIGGGRVSCDVKVYGHPESHQFIGSGKKLLQFDVAYQEGDFHQVHKDDVVGHLNTLVRWDRARRSQVDRFRQIKGQNSQEGSNFVLMEGNGSARKSTADDNGSQVETKRSAPHIS